MWKYEMHINGIYWKGYHGCPTPQQQDVEIRSFKWSEYYKGGKVELVIKKNN